MAKLTVSGYKVKTTRVMLEAYLKVLTEQRPCCTSIAKMVLWDNTELLAVYSRPQFSMMIHNMIRRMQLAYHNQHPEVKIHLISQYIGMMTLEDHIQLVRDSISLPAVLCDDRSTANL